MSKCPQCKTILQTSEADSTIQSSRNSRASRSAQQPNTTVPPPALTAPSKRPAPASTLSPSARSSKQLPPTSRAEPQGRDMQQGSSLTTPAAASKRAHRSTEVPGSTLRPSSTKSLDHPITGPVESPAADSSEKVTTSSQTLSTRTSSPPLSTADGRHTHSGQLVDLNLLQYKSRNRGGRPPGESPSYGDWMRTADILLEEVPSGRDWREKLTSMDSSIIDAVAMGIAPVIEGDLSPTEDVERKELIRLVRKYAERHSEGRLNFQHYILVCLCKVLSSQGVPKEKIVETLQICVSNTGRRNIDRYLQGATWSNKLMDELFHTDWSYRAVDLIAICKVTTEQ